MAFTPLQAVRDTRSCPRFNWAIAGISTAAAAVEWVAPWASPSTDFGEIRVAGPVANASVPSTPC